MPRAARTGSVGNLELGCLQAVLRLAWVPTRQGTEIYNDKKGFCGFPLLMCDCSNKVLYVFSSGHTWSDPMLQMSHCSLARSNRQTHARREAACDQSTVLCTRRQMPEDAQLGHKHLCKIPRQLWDKVADPSGTFKDRH